DRAVPVHAEDRAVVDLVPEVLDPVRVLADERGGEGVVAERCDRAEVERGATERAWAVPRDPLVGRQLDERRLPPQLVAGPAPDAVLLRDLRVDDMRPAALDLQPSTTLYSSSRSVSVTGRGFVAMFLLFIASRTSRGTSTPSGSRPHS